jgi:peroxiredoxin
MPKVEINTPAPDFTLDDFTGRSVSLAGYRSTSNVLLVFNRGFF